MSRLVSAIAAAGLIAAGLTFGSATAQADDDNSGSNNDTPILNGNTFQGRNCRFGAAVVGDLTNGLCDNLAEPTGQHYHCEWSFGGLFTGQKQSCDWRWADNTLAPPPPAP